MRRRAGSVRFDPYYKLQRWDPTTLAWRDIQRRYDRAEEATGADPIDGEKHRVMVVTMTGRHPVLVSDGRGTWSPC